MTRKEQIIKSIESYLDSMKGNIRHSHLSNELLYGYCRNGEYDLKDVDVDELAEHILNDLIEYSL